jgi:hypothetical protein
MRSGKGRGEAKKKAAEGAKELEPELEKSEIQDVARKLLLELQLN